MKMTEEEQGCLLAEPDSNRSCAIRALELFLLHSIIFLVGLFWAGTLLPQNSRTGGVFTFHNPFWRAMSHWDAGWYIRIAERGYNRLSIVFFPLYPLLMREVSNLFQIRIRLSGFIISNLALYLSFYIFLRLLTEDGWTNEKAYRAGLFMAVFPTSLFFSTAYTESLFLALTLSSFFYARQGKWLYASLLAGLTALTRNPGILLLPALAWEYFTQKGFHPRKWDYKLLFLGLIPLMLLPYLAYQWIHFGNPLTFMSTESIPIWGRHTTIPGWPIFLAAIKLVHFQFIYWWTVQLDDFLFTILALFLLILGLRLVRKSYFIFGALSFLMPLATYIRSEPLTSMPRYIVIIFPLFMILADKIKKNWLQLATVLVFTSFLIIFTALYVNGYWVA